MIVNRHDSRDYNKFNSEYIFKFYIYGRSALRQT